MSTEMTFREPVAYLSAMQLKDMPLIEMLTQIEAQERQASKEKRLGSDAAVVLEKLRSGISITQGGGKRRRYYIDGEPIKARIVNKLIRRGYITEPANKETA